VIGYDDIEQGIKDLCDQQKTSGKWPWLAAVKSYGGEFDEDLLDVVKRFPAIWVTTAGSDGSPEKLSHNKVKDSVKVVVLVGASSVRNEEARRHGAGADIGTYSMLKHVRKLFTNNTLKSVGLEGLDPLELGKTKTIFNTIVRGKSISVIAQEFTTGFIFKASDRDREDEDTEAEIQKINIDYYYQPNDGLVDESDLVELKR
jgi:phage gp37-like protein